MFQETNNVSWAIGFFFFFLSILYIYLLLFYYHFITKFALDILFMAMQKTQVKVICSACFLLKTTVLSPKAPKRCQQHLNGFFFLLFFCFVLFCFVFFLFWFVSFF